MFAVGKRVSFTYLKNAVDTVKNGHLLRDEVSNAQHYAGTVEDIRNITDSPLSNTTWRYGKVKGSRSENLVTVKLDSGDVKKFYDGRMVDAMQPVKQVSFRWAGSSSVAVKRAEMDFRPSRYCQFLRDPQGTKNEIN